jgi:hypothetical protein
MTRVGAEIGRSSGGGFLLGLSDWGAVVVDHAGGCPWLGPRLDVAFDFLGRVGGVRVMHEVAEENSSFWLAPCPRAGPVWRRRSTRLTELTGVVQSFLEPPWMGRVADRELGHPLPRSWRAGSCRPGRVRRPANRRPVRRRAPRPDRRHRGRPGSPPSGCPLRRRLESALAPRQVGSHRFGGGR